MLIHVTSNFPSFLKQPAQADGISTFKGYNTDWAAAIGAIEQELCTSVGQSKAAGPSPLAGKTFLVVGAGGAGRALAFGAASKCVRF
jgi:3-dehydroquinate dehydratase/shikimate dehydrogenase